MHATHKKLHSENTILYYTVHTSYIDHIVNENLKKRKLIRCMLFQFMNYNNINI